MIRALLVRILNEFAQRVLFDPILLVLSTTTLQHHKITTHTTGIILVAGSFDWLLVKHTAVVISRSITVLILRLNSFTMTYFSASHINQSHQAERGIHPKENNLEQQCDTWYQVRARGVYWPAQAEQHMLAAVSSTLDSLGILLRRELSPPPPPGMGYDIQKHDSGATIRQPLTSTIRGDFLKTWQGVILPWSRIKFRGRQFCRLHSVRKPARKSFPVPIILRTNSWVGAGWAPA